MHPINDNHTRVHSERSSYTQLVFIAAEKQNHTYADVWLYGCFRVTAFFTHHVSFMIDFLCSVLVVNGLMRLPAFVYIYYIFHYCGHKIPQHTQFTQQARGFMHSTWGAGREGRRVVNDTRPKVRLVAFHRGLFSESEQTFPCWEKQHKFLKGVTKKPCFRKKTLGWKCIGECPPHKHDIKICEIKFTSLH